MDTEYNPDIYSDQLRWVGDDSAEGGHFEPVTWREIALQLSEELSRLRLFAKLVRDLDRNEHGRHEGDGDFSDPTGVSQGNPRLWSDRVIGYDISGRPYIMPKRGKRHDPKAWGARD